MNESPATPTRVRPTLEAVAAHAGVSRATVSRVVNKASSVDPRLVEQVGRSIRALNYVPNQAARALMTRRTDTVALIAAESGTRIFGDPFFAAIVRGVSLELSKADMSLVLMMVQSDEELRRVEGYLHGGHVDGALVISEHDRHDVLGHAADAAIPVVVGGRPVAPRDGVVYVDHANSHGAALAAARLQQTGRERIGTVTGPLDMSAGVDRLAGFRERLGDRFDPGLVEEGDFTTPGGRAAVERLLARRPDVDGLFVASDMMALGVIAGLRSAGREVPGDVAVIGFDDAEVAAATTPALTTVRQRTVDQGRLMTQVLLRRLGRPVEDLMPELAASPDAAAIVLDVDLVVRETA